MGPTQQLSPHLRMVLSFVCVQLLFAEIRNKMFYHGPIKMNLNINANRAGSTGKRNKASGPRQPFIFSNCALAHRTRSIFSKHVGLLGMSKENSRA